MSDDKKNKDAVLINQSSNLPGDTSDISAKLRNYFNALASEPIPDRFLELLEKLDEAEARSSKFTNVGSHLDGSGDGGQKR